MSKIYRCIDCGKEFKFNFSDIKLDVENEDSEQFQQKVYHRKQIYIEINKYIKEVGHGQIPYFHQKKNLYALLTPKDGFFQKMYGIQM